MRTNRTGNIKPETRNAMLDQLALAADRQIELQVACEFWERQNQSEPKHVDFVKQANEADRIITAYLLALTGHIPPRPHSNFGFDAPAEPAPPSPWKRIKRHITPRQAIIFSAVIAYLVAVFGITWLQS